MFSIVAQHYEWPYKMHSLLPLVARKLANECDAISRSVVDLFTSSHPQQRQWRSQCESQRIERLKRRTDRDVIPVFNLLIFRRNKVAREGRGKWSESPSHRVACNVINILYLMLVIMLSLLGNSNENSNISSHTISEINRTTTTTLTL